MRPVVRYGVMRPVVNYGYARRKGGGGWSPAQLDAYLATLDRAFAYDFSQTDRTWQDVVGSIIADDPGENIALVLDSGAWGGTYAQMLAGQTELWVSPTLGDWTDEGGGVYEFDHANLGAGYDPLRITMPANVRYNLAFTETIISIGNALNLSGSGGSPTYASTLFNGSFTYRIRETTGAFEFRRTSANAFVVQVSAVSLKAILGKAGVQATANFQPKRHANGGKYDGSDDRSEAGYGLSGSGDLFMFDCADIPASLASTQILFGTQDGSSNGAYVGVTPAGALRVKIGATVVDSTGVDLRGGQHKLGAFTVGSTVYLVADDVIVGSGTWTGSLPTTTWNLGSVNANGTPSAFFGGSLLCPVHGRDTIDLARAKQITSAIAAKG